MPLASNTQVRKFEESVKRHGLISRGDTIFVACSGGPDSTALFYLLLEIRSSWNLKLGLLHFHHGLRGREADRDETFVKNLAARYQAPFYRGKKSVLVRSRRSRESVEEAARKSRYEFFVDTARKHRIPKIALAHTQDDQAETVLMRVIQGTGSRGLLGIRRSMPMDGVRLIRPLLDFSKRELEKYLRQKKISSRRDLSNESLRFFRNRVRKKLIPELIREFNPRVVQALARLPAILQDEADWMEQMEQEAWVRTVDTKSGSQVRMRRESFLALPAALQFRVLQRALQVLDPKSGLDFDAWNRLSGKLNQRQYRHSLRRDVDFHLSSSFITLFGKKGKAGVAK